MTIAEKIDLIIQQDSELPPEAQEELLQSLIDQRADYLGVYQPDTEETNCWND